MARLARTPSLVSLLAVVAALCFGPRIASAQPDPDSLPPGLAVDVQAPSEYLPWRSAMITVTVINTSDDRIFVLHGVERSFGSPLPAPFRPFEPYGAAWSGEPADGRYVIRATRLIHDIGPRAELPRPPRWDVNPSDDGPDGQMVPRFVLRPGRSIAFRCEGRFTYKHEGVTFLSMNVSRLESLDGVWRLAKVDRTDFPRAGSQGTGEYVPSARYTATYEPATPDAPEPTRGSSPGAPDLPLWLLDRRTTGFEHGHPVQWDQRIRVLHYHPDIDEYRGMLGISDDDYTRAVAAGVWVFRDGEYTWVAGESAPFAVHGNLLPLARALNRSETVSVAVGEPRGMDEERPTNRLIEGLVAAGLEVRDAPEKGGLVRPVVDVAARRFHVFAWTVSVTHCRYGSQGATPDPDGGAATPEEAAARWAQGVSTGDPMSLLHVLVDPREISPAMVRTFRVLRFTGATIDESDRDGNVDPDKATVRVAMTLDESVIDDLRRAMQEVMLHQGILNGLRGSQLLDRVLETEQFESALESLRRVKDGLWLDVRLQHGRWFVEQTSTDPPQWRVAIGNARLLRAAMMVILAENSGRLPDDFRTGTIEELGPELDLDPDEFEDEYFRAADYRIVILDNGDEQTRADWYVEVRASQPDAPPGVYRVNRDGERGFVTEGDDTDREGDSDE